MRVIYQWKSSVQADGRGQAQLHWYKQVIWFQNKSDNQAWGIDIANLCRELRVLENKQDVSLEHAH